MVFSPLRFRVLPPTELTPVSFGSSVRLPCVAESDLKTTITWTKDGATLPDETTFLQDNTLVLDGFKKSHEGYYTCTATNALSKIKAKAKLNSPVGVASCSMIKKYVSSVSGNYIIDPDGERGLAPFTVYCDMTAKNGLGVTVISHDSETRTHVRGYNPRGSYSRDIHYTGAGLSQLASLTRVSSSCEVIYQK